MVWPFKRRSPSPSSYEKILDSLSSKIRESETYVYRLQASMRRAIGLVTIYTLLAYAIFLSFVGITRKYRDPQMIFHSITAPVGIYLVRRVIFFVFGKKIQRQESKLKVLRGQQKAKIEDLKSSMKYYTTKSLLDRYDSENGKTPDAGPKISSKKDIDSRSATVDIPMQRAQEDSIMDEKAALYQLTQQNKAKLLPQQSSWFDRILDVVVGEDETSPRNRYALICANCFSHNGLAPPGQTPENVKYICPVCGEWNPKQLPTESIDEPESAAEVLLSDTGESSNGEAESAIAGSEILIEPKPIPDLPRRRKTTDTEDKMKNAA